MTDAAEWGDPEPFGEDEDGEALFWECPNPDCATQKTTAAKAAAHCGGDSANSSASPTDTDVRHTSDGKNQPTGTPEGDEATVGSEDGEEGMNRDSLKNHEYENAPENGDSPDTAENEVATDVSSPSEPRGTTGKEASEDAPDPARVRAAVSAVLRYYHDDLEREISDHVGPCDHDSCGEDGTECDRPATAREYFREIRGWTDDRIEDALLGWGPADDDAQDELLETLAWEHGFSPEEIRATGLFHEDLSPKWQGRYVLPYLDEDGRPVYGISRCTDPADRGGGGALGEKYDGHPADRYAKYDKHIKNHDYAHPPDEPIFGLGSVEDGEPLLVAGGIADAITLQQAGYPCVSPVTTVRFKGPDLRKIIHLAWERDIPRVYIVNDAEPPTSEEKELDRDAESIGDALNIRPDGEGRKAAIANARDFTQANIPTFFVDLPRPAGFKVDPDDAVLGGWGDLDAMLASAKPAEQNDEYQKRVAEEDPRRVRHDGRLLTAAARPLDGPTTDEALVRADAVAGASRTGVGRGRRSSTGHGSGEYDDASALFDLTFTDVAGMANNDRGDNPAGHHGNSHDYYTTFNNGELGYDHKDKVTHNALTYLLVEAGERDAANAEGELSDREKYIAWRHAKTNGYINKDDSIPLPALFHVLVESDENEYEADDWVWRNVETGEVVGSSNDAPGSFDDDVRFGLPPGGFNTGLDLLDEGGVDHGREHIDGGEGVEPVPSIPFAMLSRPRDELVRFARKRGLDWPDTDAARDRLGDELRDAIEDEGYAVLDAPTGLGKTHEASSTFWRDLQDVTDDQPVVLFASTTDARDEARDMARDAGLDVKALLGRNEACPVCAGEFDAENCDDELHGTVVSIDEATRGEDFEIEMAGDTRTVPASAEQVKARVEREQKETGDTVTITQPVGEDLAVGDEFVIQEEQEPVYIEGKLASAWMADKCDNRGLAVSTAHSEAKDLAAQGYVAHDKEASDDGTGSAAVPCCPGDMKCRTETQWPGEAGWCDDDGVPRYDLIVATDPFAYVPKLRSSKNVISDEQPDYTADLGTSTDAERQQRVETAIDAFLKHVDAPAQVHGYGGLMHVGAHGFSHNEHAEPGAEPTMDERYDALREALDEQPDRDWYLHADGAHTLAPGLARAVYYAAREEPDANGRRTATVPHEPPRLDADAGDDEGFNRTWVTVVLNADDEVETIRDAPDFSTARSVVGLDARPNPWLWQRNTHPDTTVERVLETDERALWRRLEQGTTVVQVGDATRPPGEDGCHFTESHADAVIEQLRAEFGDDFQTAGCASAVEQRVQDLMADHGIDVDGETTMHFGEEKSRNDFADEVVGLVYGCIDPGDDYVLNLAAECELDVQPTMHDCPECGGDGCGPANDDCHDGLCRDRGREFTGADREHGTELLASVRENHVAQMAGRFGRNLEDGQQSVVFVATDASPPGFVDYEVPGVLWMAQPNQKQRALVEYLRQHTGDPDEPVTAGQASDAVGCSKKHAIEDFRTLVEQDKATVRDGDGPHGADVWRWRPGAMASATPFSHVDLAPEDVADETVTSSVWSTRTWEVTISPSESASVAGSSLPEPDGPASNTTLGQFGGSKGSDPPPD